ncbi:Iron-responsive repressor RirA [Liberibacter crescens BT-1]|uniref:Iron-responsive repressor RirA n=2 Tax=Liberibacter crescens TaxID=1273132 RepID=L0EW41_LIBCB|nr:Iron-responsive repressor RirA [Liberibacter crescens BT-1]
MYCAVNEGRLSRIAQIAKVYGVSELFLFKVLQPLTKAGIIETVRGRHGGIRLRCPASKITVLDVVKVTEESFYMASCFEEGVKDCPLTGNCSLSSVLQMALNAFFDVLMKYSIEYLVKTQPQIRSLLDLEDFDSIASKIKI